MDAKTNKARAALLAPPGPLAERIVAAMAACPWVGDCRHLEPGGRDDEASFVDVLIVQGVVTDRRRTVSSLSPRHLETWIARGLKHLVLLSSTAVHVPSHRHPGRVSERYLSTTKVSNRIAKAWRDLEDSVREVLRDTGTVLTVLRPTTIAIDAEGMELSRLLSGRVALTPVGYDPTIQLLSPRDFVATIVETARQGLAAGAEDGTFHVAPTASLSLRQMLRAAGVARLPLPLALLRLLRWLSGRLADGLEYLRYPWTVSGDRLKDERGVESTSSSLEAVLELRGHTAADSSVEEDPFGLDKAYVQRLGKTLFRFLHNVWWRIEWRGLEKVPRRGRTVLVGNHRGHQPWDGVMMMFLVARELGRHVRFLIHPALVKAPFLAPYMTKCGGVNACQENAEWVLDHEEILAIFPEGIRGAFRMYDRDVYKLGRFGRSDFVKIALRHQAPIIPFVTVGSAETFPIFGRIDWGWWRRVTEWPFLPITPTMSTVPLPSKWHTVFLDPLHVERVHGPEAAEDPDIVRQISNEVHTRMDEAISDLLQHRRSKFFGSIFKEQLPVPKGTT